MITILGIDPGLASCGLALLRGDEPLACEATVIRTAPETKKRRNLRVSDDDARRYRALWDRMLGFSTHDLTGVGPRSGLAVPFGYPDAIAVEAYSCRGPGGHKAMAVYGLAHGLAASWGSPVFVYQPTDVKRGILGGAKGSKVEVQAALDRELGAEPWAHLPKTQQEHAADAAALALLGLREMRELRKRMGLA